MAGIYSLSDFEKDLLKLAKDMSGGKEAQKFMKSEGNKLKNKVKKHYKKKAKKPHKGITDNFKRGKPYMYNKDELSIRAYNSHPLAHLQNDGFIHRGGKKHEGKETFVKGTHYLESARDEYESEYEGNVSKWLDKMIEKGL